MSSQILNVPYISQLKAEGGLRADCGLCCVSMILNAVGQELTPAVIAAVNGVAGDEGASPAGLARLARAVGLDLTWKQGLALDDLKRYLDSGYPLIALVKYGKIPDRPVRRFTGAHHVLVIGYDDDAKQILIHDPHYSPDPTDGCQRAWSYRAFKQAWGGLVKKLKLGVLIPALIKPVPSVGAGLAPALEAVSFAAPGAGLGDVWVVAPAGLMLRTQKDVPAGPGSPSLNFGQHLKPLSPESAPDDKGITWLQVSTDQGTSGWTAASASGERYLADKQPPEPYVAQVLDTPPVRQAGALSVRDARNIEAPLLDRIQIGEQFTVYLPVAEADGSSWLWIRSPRGKYGWAREKADGVALVAKVDQAVPITIIVAPPAPPPFVDVNPFGKCLAGLGTANPWPLQDQDYGVIAAANMELVKLLAPSREAPGQGADDAKRLMREGRTVMGRLFEKPANRRISAQEFVDSVAEGFEELYKAGVRYFEIHNEPNLPHDGLGVSWANGAEFGQWFINIYNALKARHPDAQLGYPGLSPQFNNPGLPAESDTWRFLDGSEAAVQRADWIGVHCYWQNEGDGHWAMLSELDGMLWKKFRARWPNKLIFITEFSNNGRHIDYATKGDQYARYYNLLRREPNLGGAIAFALYWPGQDANREGWRTDHGINEVASKVGAVVKPGF